MITRRVALSTSLGLVAAGVASTAFAADPCAKYYGKGYCTDYVNTKISPKQSGDASRWPSNISSSEVRAGDVAIFRSINHVAYVDSVATKDSKGRALTLNISEWNYGSTAKKTALEKSCIVTDKFGIKTTRKIAVSAAVYMRPGKKK